MEFTTLLPAARKHKEASKTVPEYCQVLRFKDSNGQVKEMIFPKGLDLDRPKRPRTTFSEEQLNLLEAEFQKNQYLVGKDRSKLAQKLGLSETQVKVWYQNRRTKTKREKSTGGEPPCDGGFGSEVPAGLAAAESGDFSSNSDNESNRSPTPTSGASIAAAPAASLPDQTGIGSKPSQLQSTGRQSFGAASLFPSLQFAGPGTLPGAAFVGSVMPFTAELMSLYAKICAANTTASGMPSSAMFVQNYQPAAFAPVAALFPNCLGSVTMSQQCPPRPASEGDEDNAMDSE